MIAISYRREDSTPVAGRLHDRLRAEFGRENVFMDFDSIPYGVDFREQIKSTLERADVVVAVVGPTWLGGEKEASRRIDDPSDFVRLEIAGALQRGIPVIPILVDDTPMPKPETLPADMQAFAFRNALVLDTGIDFHHHADRLVAGIRQLLEKVATKPAIGPAEPERTVGDRLGAALPDADSKHHVSPDVAATADVDLAAQSQSATEEAVSKPTPHLKKPSMTPGALKSDAPSLPAELTPTEPLKFNWKQKQIAIAGGALVLVAAISFGIMRFERKRSTEERATSPMSESTATASTTPVEAAATTTIPTTSSSPAPAITVAQSTAAPIAMETVSANGAADSWPLGLTPSPSVPEQANGIAPSVSSVDETEAVRQFVRDFYAAMSRHDLDTVVNMFADDVDYQGQGRHDRRYIRNDIRNYFRRWDRIQFEMGSTDVSHTREGDFQVKFNFPFAVGQGYAPDKRGVSSQVWILHKDGHGDLQITSQRERVLAGSSETRQRRR
jgi:ketosteroid isomerase-like protein